MNARAEQSWRRCRDCTSLFFDRSRPGAAALCLRYVMIMLDLQTFRQTPKTGNVTGVIFLEWRGASFPEQGWLDFPVILLGWWMDAWLQLEVPTRREVQWVFMEGPYAARLTKVASPASDAALRSSQVFTSLLEAGERVIAHCDEHKMITRDLEVLRENVNRFKAKPRGAEDGGFALQLAFGRRAAQIT